MAQGKLIVLEGTDGSGKRTQMDLLVAALKARNIPVETMDFPRYEDSFFGALAGRMLKGEFGGINSSAPELAVLPFACDRWLLKNDLLKWLLEGKIVVSNRYTASSAVYQASKLPAEKQQAFIQWVYKLEQEIIGLPKENLVLFLYMPVSVSQLLLAKKAQRAYLGDKKKDIYEEDQGIQLTVEKLYQELATHQPQWKTIACANESAIRTPDQIQKDILDVLTQNGVL
jgi:dTMP kinase